MSFGLPSLKVKPEHAANIQIHEGPFGVPDPLVAGLSSTKSKLGVSHPLEVSERNFHMNQEKMNMAMLRNIQGLHAPLKLTMEMKFTNKYWYKTTCVNAENSVAAVASYRKDLCRSCSHPTSRKSRFEQYIRCASNYDEVGHLPFLQRSNFQSDILTGRHLEVGFEDILNTPELCEVAGQPHAVVERSLGIL